jgi:hypothetical protein
LFAHFWTRSELHTKLEVFFAQLVEISHGWNCDVEKPAKFKKSFNIYIKLNKTKSVSFEEDLQAISECHPEQLVFWLGDISLYILKN